jgi:diguanylate cyclase (GGDEF)-like protein/PAS domain S-box-containing protein
VQTQIARTQERFRYAVEAAGLGIWDWELPGGYCYTSPQFLVMLGRDSTFTQITQPHSWVHPQDRPALDFSLKAHLEGQTLRHEAEYRAWHAEGRWVWIEERGLVAERDPCGRPRRLVATCSDITERVTTRLSTEWLALHDPLTGLPNRALFRRELRRALHQAAQQRSWAGLLVLDLDRFKEVNDRYGHRAGDKVLAQVARRLRNCLRSSPDIVARIGGDEFAIIIVPDRPPEAFAAVAEQVMNRLRSPFEVNSEQVTITASRGLAIQTPGAREEELLARADRAMYEAKKLLR